MFLIGLKMKADEINKIKQSRDTGKPILRTALYSYSPTIVETLGYAGIDMLYIDSEHCPVSFETLEHLCRACEVSGITPMIRVNKQYPGYPSNIRQALEIGAGVVLVPHVNNRAEVEAVVRAAKFGTKWKYGDPPGDQLRGWGGISRSKKYGVIPADEWAKLQDENTLVGVLIEEERAFKNLDEIASVEGLDYLDIGQVDYSNNLGIPGQTDDPRVKEVIKKIDEACKKNNLLRQSSFDWKEALREPEKAKEKIKNQMREGYTCFALPHEVSLLRELVQSCRKVLDEAYSEIQKEK